MILHNWRISMTSSIDYLNYFYEILFRKTLDKVQNHWLLWFTAISQLKIPFTDSRKYYHELLFLLNLSQHLKNDTILSIWNFFVATIQIIKKRCFFSFDAGWIECVQGCLQYVQFIFPFNTPSDNKSESNFFRCRNIW